MFRPVTVEGLHQTLEQELFALLRGASLECLVCGEFVLYRRSEICCPGVRDDRAAGQGSGRIRGTIRFAGRVTASTSAFEESPDTKGQDAGEIPGGESRRTVAQKGDRLRRKLSGDAGGKGETVG